MAYRTLQSAPDAGFPLGRQHYWTASYLKDLSDEAIDVMVDFIRKVPSPLTGVGLQQMHGAASRVESDATAFSHRGEYYDFQIISQWIDPANSERNIEWIREFFEAMQPFFEGGVYVNDLGEEGEGQTKAAYGQNYERLLTVKDKYDPTNLFHLNNIKPTAQSGAAS